MNQKSLVQGANRPERVLELLAFWSQKSTPDFLRDALLKENYLSWIKVFLKLQSVATKHDVPMSQRAWEVILNKDNRSMNTLELFIQKLPKLSGENKKKW